MDLLLLYKVAQTLTIDGCRIVVKAIRTTILQETAQP